MEPEEAWGYAATWGSFVRNGDPGACMYGFDENCQPQSEEHRQDVIEWMQKCRQQVVDNPEDYDDDELDSIDRFLEYIKVREVASDTQ